MERTFKGVLEREQGGSMRGERDKRDEGVEGGSREGKVGIRI